MMLPTKQRAREILFNAEACNPGAWVKHSLCVADCAEKIAMQCGLDGKIAYVLGLLHDIGRKFGITFLAHVMDGYRYMMQLGYEEAAQICLTHSFSTQCVEDYVGKNDISPEEYLTLTEMLRNFQFDDYDRLIQLCDCLAGTEVVEMSQQMDDVQARHGSYPERKRKKNMELKDYFEALAGKNIYQIVSSDASLWGR